MMAKTDVEVELIGQDGNAFAILGKVKRELVRAGYKDLAEEYINEAMSGGDYNHLLRVTGEYVEII